MRRSAGILLHPTSLPNPEPIGSLGAAAYEWIDHLADAGISWWQVLPVNPPGYAGSPYQAFSAFAGNPMLVSPETLAYDGLIAEAGDWAGPPGFADFAEAAEWKRPMLREAAATLRRASAGIRQRYEHFRDSHGAWLDDYALFMAIKGRQGGGPFFTWPEDLRHRRPVALREARTELAEEVERQAIYQFFFFDQWERLHRHGVDRGVRIIGDLPIFVAGDSADVWTRPELFDLDASGRPRVVAGVPPDYFSATGQLWGNPLYTWEAHDAEHYEWWIDRLRTLLELVDLVRIDHFRAFSDYWEIPAGAATAEHGRWVLGPGRGFFDIVEGALGHLPLIAEDLGELHETVPQLRDAVGLPGMKLGQFSFTDPPDPPAGWPEHAVGYTGTHDNDTTEGWWRQAPEVEKRRAKEMAGVRDGSAAWDLVTAVWRSPAEIAVSPIQDVLGLGTEARMNLPGTVGPQNWTWRLDRLPGEDTWKRLEDLTSGTGR